MCRLAVLLAAVVLPTLTLAEPPPRSERPGFTPPILSSPTVGARSATPILADPSLFVAGQIHLSGDSAVFKKGDTFLFDEIVEVLGEDFGSTALGRNALASTTPNDPIDYAGTSNTAVGFEALRYTSTGIGNVAVGADALRGNVTGIANVAVGTRALYEAQYAGWNTALGAYSMWMKESGDQNTGVGFATLAFSTTGAGNTAVGYEALYAGNGSLNTALGVAALRYSLVGQRNIALGYRAGAELEYAIGMGSYSDNIFLGNEGTTSDESTIRIGRHPGDLNNPGDFEQNRTFIAGIFGQSVDAMTDVPVLIDSNSQLGTMMSSRRYKEEIRDLGDASSRLLELRPVAFRYKKPTESGRRPLRYGLIAEEVAEVVPELVVYDDAGRPETIRYQLLPVMLLNELQNERRLGRERDARIRSLELRLAALEGDVGRSGSVATRPPRAPTP